MATTPPTDSLFLYDWTMQYRRMLRSYQALLDAPDNNTDLYDDPMFHFFQDAWHLKDWIKNDESAPLRANSVESQVNQSEILSAVGDLANAVKHRRGEFRKDRTGPPLVSFRTELRIGSGPRQLRYLKHEDDSVTMAADLAAKVIGEWNRILPILGLNVPT